MSVERIIAAVVDTKQLTLYREDGTTIEIPQGDPRVRGIIAQVMPVVQAKQVAEVDLSHLPNAYTEFEEKSSGLVRLFRVAKKAVASIFAPKEGVEELLKTGGVIGEVPTPAVTMASVDEILEQAQSVSDPEFKDADTTKDHTIIAVVEDEGKRTVVPGVEAIKEQFAYFGGKGSTKGMENFMRRVAKTIDKRPHSVQDLLRFLEKGDLPIADDGCIVAYKRLYSRDDVFVDPHTQRVTQRPGSIVVVDESLVDLSRRNECSNGLHIGRRGYMGGFSGDAIFMCKIAPEDVMVVPHNDPNKVRVCAYHLIARVNDRAFSLIARNQPATSDPATADLLSQVIQGKHAPADQEVRITAQYGGGLKIRPIVNGQAVDQTPVPVPAEEKHHALDDVGRVTADPKTVADQVTEAKSSGSRRERAKALMAKVHDGATTPAVELLALKRSSKVGWDKLGISLNEVELIIERAKLSDIKPVEPLEAVATPPKGEQTAVTKAKNLRQQIIGDLLDKLHDIELDPAIRFNAGQDLIAYRKKSKVSWERLGHPELTDNGITSTINNLPKSATPPKPEPEAKAEPWKGATKGQGSSQSEARKLYNENAWGALIAFKRAKKKSWAALGFTSEEETEIKTHIGD